MKRQKARGALICLVLGSMIGGCDAADAFLEGAYDGLRTGAAAIVATWVESWFPSENSS